MMRRISAVTFMLAAAVAIRAADVSFVHVWPTWRAADSFMRISEYFTGQEPPGTSVVLRSHPADRAGYYFVARVRHPSFSIAGAKFVLHIIVPSSPEPNVFTFPVSDHGAANLFELGLTGADWPTKKIRPVAWSLELLSGDGRTLAAQQSFLWSKPDKK